MNYQEQQSVDLISNYPIDQQYTVDQSLIDEAMVGRGEATTVTRNELEDFLSPRGAVMETPDELEDFLSAWESLPDEDFLIY